MKTIVIRLVRKRTLVKLIQALVGVFISESAPGKTRKTEGPLAGAIQCKLMMMPEYFALGIIVMTYFFDMATLIRAGKRFHHAKPSTQIKQVNRWRQSRVGPFGDLMRFYETLTLFELYDEKKQ